MAESTPGARRRELLRQVNWLSVLGIVAVIVAGAAIAVKNLPDDTPNQILNVSYDPTREVYKELDKSFIEQYEQHTGNTVDIAQSHGGSGRQARSVADGAQHADVVSFALPSDVEILHTRGLIADGWQQRLPNNSTPYTSTVVFVVRKGNPKDVHDWPDLVENGVSIVTPDPKTSGNGQLSLLGAWGSVTTRGGTPDQARQFLRDIYSHVAVFDAGARGAATSFAVERVGDVHLTWENEAIREVRESNGELEIVYPPVSILAEPAVAWVDANVSGDRATYAKDYLDYLFTEPAQNLFAEYGYRPVDPEILAAHADVLPDISLFPITAIAEDWSDARERFFGTDGIVAGLSSDAATQGE